ncbi:hypothetical protein OYC14_25990, partial [Escherichia coli]|uniref:hypothetical protein n=3 Tax=Escherichia coli TaxID=562 RepID=UPI0021B3DA3A
PGKPLGNALTLHHRSRHGSGSALSATGNRLGRTPDPHRCNTDGLRPPTNRVAVCSVQMGLAGGWRGS